MEVKQSSYAAAPKIMVVLKLALTTGTTIMRTMLTIAGVLAFSVASADATSFWLSPTGPDGSSAPPADAGEIPALLPSGSVYVWALTDPGETLLNWSLNIRSSKSGVINFTGVDVINPLLGQVTVPAPPKDVRRYEFVGEPAPAADGQSITSFRGLTVDNSVTIGAGIGAGTAAQEETLSPRFYDPANMSFLVAEIMYETAGAGTTDLWLQIGQNGLNNAGQGSADTDVILGALTDPALNGQFGRQQDSATPEAHVVPEPSTMFLAMLGLLGLVGCRLWNRRLC